MSELNNLLASSPVPLVANGKTYHLSHVTKNVQAAFETWIEAQVLLQLYKQKANLPERDYIHLLSEVNDKVAAGEYTFGSPACVRFGNTPKGAAHFLYLLLKEKQPQLTEAEAGSLLTEYTEECSDALSRVTVLGKARPRPEKAAPAG